MSFDERLAARIRKALGVRSGVSEKRMFGGLAFLLRGHMCCGIVDRDLVVRIGTEAYARALSEAHARPMDFTGKPLKGMVYVAPAGVRTEEALRTWVDRGVRFVLTLPAKDRASRRA